MSRQVSRGDSGGSKVTHQPTAAEINRCRVLRSGTRSYQLLVVGKLGIFKMANTKYDENKTKQNKTKQNKTKQNYIKQKTP